jgi:hypothetical protein
MRRTADTALAARETKKFEQRFKNAIKKRESILCGAQGGARRFVGASAAMLLPLPTMVALLSRSPTANSRTTLRALALAGVDTFARTNLTSATIDPGTGRTSLSSTFSAFQGMGSVDAACSATYDAKRDEFLVPAETTVTAIRASDGHIVARHAVAVGQKASTTSVDAPSGRYFWVNPGDGVYQYDATTNETSTVAPLPASDVAAIRCVSGVDTRKRWLVFAALRTPPPNVTLAVSVVDMAKPSLVATHVIDMAELGGLEALTYDDANDQMLLVTARAMQSGWRISTLDTETGVVTRRSEFAIDNATMWLHGNCGFTAAAGSLWAILALAGNVSARVLAQVDVATGSALSVKQLDVSFAPAAGRGYQGPEWAAISVVGGHSWVHGGE